jgi:uncharacterized protein involved in response to NO
MLFGFATAALAGFLLTSVPHWTGADPLRRAPLATLVALWLAGRVSMVLAFELDPNLVALTDIAFVPALALALGPSLVGARGRRHGAFLPLLVLLFLCNLLFHLGEMSLFPFGELIGIGAALDVFLVLIVVIGGRVIPQITREALIRLGRKSAIAENSWLDRFAIAAIVFVLLADLIVPHSQLAGDVSLGAALVQAARLAQWKGYRAIRDPLVWVLHLSYAWLIAGLLLKGLWLVWGAFFASEWVHALTVGAFATMIMAIMTRGSLVETGRPLVASDAMGWTYLTISFAALVRVFGPALFPQAGGAAIAIAGLAFLEAFAVFLWLYAPVLANPRLTTSR